MWVTITSTLYFLPKLVTATQSKYIKDLKVGKKTSHDGKLDIIVKFGRTGSNCDNFDAVLRVQKLEKMRSFKDINL